MAQGPLIFLFSGAGAATLERSAALDATADVISAGQIQGASTRSVALDATATIASAGIEVISRSAALSGTATIAASGAGVVDTQVHNLVATATSNSTITLSWDDVTALTGETFDIERDAVVILEDYAGTHTAGSPYTDSGLDPGTTYTYRVRAVL